MLRASKTGFALLAATIVLLCGLEPASAGCQLIRATNSAESKSSAARAAHATALQTAEQIRQQRGWGYVNVRAKMVAPDPFWKSVRPVVTPDMLLKPDVVTAQTYSQCWKGVVVPFVCTAGAIACGK